MCQHGSCAQRSCKKNVTCGTYGFWASCKLQWFSNFQVSSLEFCSCFYASNEGLLYAPIHMGFDLSKLWFSENKFNFWTMSFLSFSIWISAHAKWSFATSKNLVFFLFQVVNFLVIFFLFHLYVMCCHMWPFKFASLLFWYFFHYSKLPWANSCFLICVDITTFLNFFSFMVSFTYATHYNLFEFLNLFKTYIIICSYFYVLLLSTFILSI